jgi:hypothetical protein
MSSRTTAARARSRGRRILRTRWRSDAKTEHHQNPDPHTDTRIATP